MPTVTSKSSPLLSFFAIKTTSSKWHYRLGHSSSSIFKHIVSSFQLKWSNSCNTNLNCNACQCNKSHKLPFSVSTLTTASLLEVIFSNVWTLPIQSIDDFKYYVIFIDHFIKYMWFYPLKIKSHVFNVFVHFKSLVENHFQQKIVTLYSDNRGEFQALSTFLATNCVSHLSSHNWNWSVPSLPCVHASVTLVICLLHRCLPNKPTSHPCTQSYLIIS